MEVTVKRMHMRSVDGTRQTSCLEVKQIEVKNFASLFKLHKITCKA